MSFLRIIPLHRSGICYLCSPTMGTWLHSTLALRWPIPWPMRACSTWWGKKWKWGPKFNLSMLDTCTTRSPHKTIFSMMMMLPPNTSQMVVNNPHYPHKQFLVGCLTSTTQFVVQESPPFHSSSLSHIAVSASMVLADLWQMTLLKVYDLLFY